MADIAASDVTVTCLPADRGQFNLRLKANFVGISFGNATLTVPAGGAIPLPTKGFFGMLKYIRALIIIAGQGAYFFVYDKAAHTLVAYHGDYSASSDGPSVPAAGVAIAAQSLEAIAIGE
jgi:hypothetical protein